MSRLKFILKLLPIILAIRGESFANGLTEYYNFSVFDYDTKKPIEGATVSVTYKVINWGPAEGRNWSGKTASGTTDYKGAAAIYCLDYGHEGLFDVESGDQKFGPYAERGLVIASVNCKAAGFETINLTHGNIAAFEGHIRAGGSRGEGITFYLKAKDIGVKGVKDKTPPPSGKLKCWLEVSPNPASIPQTYTVRWYIENATNADVVVYSITDSGNTININKTASARATTLLKADSGTTYTPGNFKHSPIIFRTSAGDIRAPDYVFVVR